MKALIAPLFVLLAGSAGAQQYQNFEIHRDGSGTYSGTHGNRNFEARPNASGGYSGTYGGRNFETAPDYGLSGELGGRGQGGFQEPHSWRGRPGETNQSCVVDPAGNVICR